jgi:hypothetical protein
MFIFNNLQGEHLLQKQVDGQGDLLLFQCVERQNRYLTWWILPATKSSTPTWD